jgi:hypothetical protein
VRERLLSTFETAKLRTFGNQNYKNLELLLILFYVFFIYLFEDQLLNLITLKKLNKNIKPFTGFHQ